MKTLNKSKLKYMRSYVRKLIALRKKLIANKKSFINNARAFAIIENIRIWMDAYPYVNEQQFSKFLKRNYNDLKYLVPGGACKSSAKWIEQLDGFLKA